MRFMNGFFESLFKIKGRIGRKDFLIRVVVVYFLGAGLLTIMGSNINNLAQIGKESIANIFAVVLLVFSIVLNVAYIMLCIRRLHDLNMSGLWLIAVIVFVIVVAGAHPSAPFILPLLFNLVLSLLRGTMGPNRFGADPLSRGLDAE